MQSRAFAALQNLLSVLPRDTLHNQGGVAAVWRRVIELVASGGVAVCDDVTGLLVVLARAMEDEELQVSALQLRVCCVLCWFVMCAVLVCLDCCLFDLAYWAFVVTFLSFSLSLIHSEVHYTYDLSCTIRMYMYVHVKASLNFLYNRVIMYASMPF